MKSRLCYAWFGDEDVQLAFSSPAPASGSDAHPGRCRTTLNHDGSKWEFRHESGRQETSASHPAQPASDRHGANHPFPGSDS